MRVTKKLRSELEILDSLQKISGYKNSKNSKEKSPRTILLQKISSNDNNIPIKVQLLKTKNNFNINNNNNILNKNIFNINTNPNSNSLSLNKKKIPFPKNDINFYPKDNFHHLKSSFVSNNKSNNTRLISESPISNTKYKNSTHKSINQSPIKKTSDNDLNVNLNSENEPQNTKEHKIRNVLSKNLAYNKKKPNSTINSPNIGLISNLQKMVYQSSRKNTSDSNNNSVNNNEYGTKTYVGRDNYSVNSFNNKNINSPKTPSYVTDIDSNNINNIKNNNNNNIGNTNIINTNTNSHYIKNNYFIDIKLEDLIIFEERLNDIIIAINHGNSHGNNNIGGGNKFDVGACNECYEFFSFYFHSSLKYKFPSFFHEPNRIIIQSAINLKLFIIMITYHLSINSVMILKLIDDLKLIYSLLKQNLYLFIKKLNIFYGEAFILQNEIYFKTFNYILTRNGLNNLNENEIKDIINQNCCNIVKNISNILNYYKALGNPFYLDFYEIFNILSRITEKEINNYFYTYLYGYKRPKNPFIINKKSNLKYNINNITIPKNNQNNSNSNNLNNLNKNNHIQILEYQKNKNKNKISYPFITTPTDKKYTLVLDLDNTLISHNNRNTNDMCNLRPGLLSFLNTLKPLYELISFTNEPKEYSEQLLKEIESNRKYFDYNLYREHNILIGNNLVKDISKIGRDMKKIIIVDKLIENIKCTPDNGILIKPYYGETNKNDTVLFELKKLLVLFHKMGYEDLRIAIKNYSNDIKYKITLDNK